jgi:hypothetical protein
MFRFAFIALAALLIVLPHSADAHEGHHGAEGACTGPELKCATTATPVFASDDKLWLAWAADGRVWVAQSADLGHTFSPAVAASAVGGLPLDSGPDARPKIAVGKGGRIVVAYAVRDPKYNGTVFIARSTDGGATFAAPERLTAGSPSQRFETIAFDPGGSLFAAWIDKRNVAAAHKAGEKYNGAALAFSWEGGNDAHFAPARIARDNTCECCRIGVGFAGAGKPVVVFRNIFPGSVRDHALVAFSGPDTPGPVHRVSDDDWVTEACPHQGPSLAVAADGSFHVTWFTAGRNRKGVFYARSTDGGEHFSAPMPLGTPGHQSSRPYVLAGPDALHLAWKEFDGEQTTIMLMSSRDNGATWSRPRALARTANAADHPLLVSDAHRSYLSWQTVAEGYRLLPIEVAP